MSKQIWPAFLLLLALACGGPGTAPVPARTVAGSWHLVQASDSTYRLVSSRAGAADSLVAGKVLLIGWTRDVIALSRVSPAGDTAFVMVDPRDGVIRGPMQVLNIALPAGLRLEPPARAWARLR